MKNIAFSVALGALALSGTLGACSQSTPEEKAPEAAETSAPDAKPGMSLAKGQLTLPIVTGRPAAVHFELTNGGKEPVTLVSAYVEGASSAEIHETTGGTMQKRDTIEIKPGETVAFAKGGLHVMAFDLTEGLTDGGTTELTLTFAGGDKLSAPITISSGVGQTDMSGMDHGMSGMEH